jgi:hypothetical protein
VLVGIKEGFEGGSTGVDNMYAVRGSEGHYVVEGLALVGREDCEGCLMHFGCGVGSWGRHDGLGFKG